MNIDYSSTLVPRILFTIMAEAIAIGPMIADFNRTHATNPLWTPHARFHVVWQVLSQTGVSGVTFICFGCRPPPMPHTSGSLPH